MSYRNNKSGGNRGDDLSEGTSGQQETVGLEGGYLVSPNSNRQPVLSVVMPTLNEEEGIEECIRSVQRAIKQLKVPTEVIVSDSSTDRTPEIARKMGAHVVEPDASGYGAAYRHGFNRARGEYLAMGDADTTYDFEQLPELFTLVQQGEADIAMGSRLNGEIKPGAMPALHQFVGNPLLTRFLNTFYDADVSDAHSGFRVLSRGAWETLDMRSTGMEFASEMIMDASVKGLTIAEVPITYHERKGEATLDSFRDGWRHVRFMLENAPGYLFTVPSVVFIALGIVTLVLSVVGVSLFDVTFKTHTAIAGSLLTLVGYQLGSLGLFSSVGTNPVRVPSDPVTRVIRDRFQLEHGASIGVVLFALGACYIGVMLGRWVVSGYTAYPEVAHNLVGFTLILVGVQTVFSSFFLSMLAKSSEVTRP